MDFFEAVKARYSYRGGFTEQTVSEADLERIVQAGIDAPSGVNYQTTRFVIVNDPEKLQALAEILPDRPAVATARAVIVCVADPNREFRGESYAVEDCAAAVENMCLAVAALGYATVWLDGVLRRDHIALRVGKLLSVPEDLQVRVLLPIGIAEEPGDPAQKLSIAERAFWNVWRED